MQDTAKASPIPEISRLSPSDLWAALRFGWSDFRRAPLFGIFFSLTYVIGGWILFLIFQGTGAAWWGIPFVAGFPLIAPFAAVGLYEVSRKLETNDVLNWRQILGVVLAERNRQVPYVGVLIMVWFLFWLFLAHAVFALVMGISSFSNPPSGLEMITTRQGAMMLLLETSVGAVFAFVVFAVTTVSLPLLLDREIDFITAMIISVRTVVQNFSTMLLWALIITIGVALGMVTGFLGLLIMLPLFGHATWHLYRRALTS